MSIITSYYNGKGDFHISTNFVFNFILTFFISVSIPEHDEADEISDENKEKVNDQAKLIVGIVVGLLLAALVAGVVYWLYMKKSKTASKHVNKDLGNMEENKKLEENNHKTEA